MIFNLGISKFDFRFKIVDKTDGVILTLFSGSEEGVVQIYPKSTDSYYIKLINGKTADNKQNWQIAKTYNYRDWHKCTLVVSPNTNNYKCYLDDERVEGVFSFFSTMTLDELTQFRFQASQYTPHEFYIDDIKIAQSLAMIPETNGEYNCFFDGDGNPITLINPNKTVYKAKIINNTCADENMILLVPLYNSDCTRLIDLKMIPFTVAANSTYDVSTSYDNLGALAYTSKIKAFFFDGVSGIQPYKKTMIPSASLDSANGQVLSVSAYALKPAYPDGNYKAVTVRIDDGAPDDIYVVEGLKKKLKQPSIL